MKSFLIFYRHKPLLTIDNEDVIIYNNDFILKNNLSASYQNQIASAIKLFFAVINHTKIDIERIHRPKRARVLGGVFFQYLSWYGK